MSRIIWLAYGLVFSLHILHCGSANEVTTSKPNKNFYDAMRDLLNFIYKTQKNSDQFHFDKYQFAVNTTVITCDVFLGQIILSGFSSFDYKFQQLSKSSGTNSYKFSLTTSYEKLRFIVDNYKLDLDILTMIPIYGEGRAGLLLGDFKSTINVTLGQTKEGVLTADELSLDIILPTIQTSFTGLLNTEAQSDLVSTAFSFILPTVFADIKPYLMMGLNPLTKYKLNQFFTQQKLTVDQLVKFIESYIG